MATRCLRCLVTTKRFSQSSAVLPSFSSFVVRLRPLVAAASASHYRCLVPAISTPAFSTLNSPNPNVVDKILLNGCDLKHWLVVMDPPELDPTRDEIIDSYIKTLAMVIGSEEEAKMKIYSISTRHYYAFGALVEEELVYRIKELPGVHLVLPDSYVDVANEKYGGEPFIDGQAVPYEPNGKKAVKKGKPAMDLNNPKRPANAFFVFMEKFRKQHKEKHPDNKSFAAVAKAGGDKWKSLSEAEKAPYIAEAEKRKAEYGKNHQGNNKK